MKKIIRSIFIIWTILVFSGCASIVGKNTQLFTVNSDPDQADVLITDEANMNIFRGKTPTTVTLQKGGGYFHGKDYKVTISKIGYASQIVSVISHPNGWYIGGNILFGGLIGWFIVDPLTGAMWTLDPESINAVLNKEVKQSKVDKNTISIVLLKDVPHELRDKMIRIPQKITQ